MTDFSLSGMPGGFSIDLSNLQFGAGQVPVPVPVDQSTRDEFGFFRPDARAAAEQAATLKAEAAELVTAANAGTAKYAAVSFPFVDGGCVYLSIGADATGIVVAYCDASVRRFTALHRPVAVANQIAGDFSVPPRDYQAFTAAEFASFLTSEKPATIDDYYVPSSLAAVRRGVLAISDLTASAEDENAVTRSRMWLLKLSQFVDAERDRLHSMTYHIRFRRGVREWLLAADDQPEPSPVVGHDTCVVLSTVNLGGPVFGAANLPRVAYQLRHLRPAKESDRRLLADRLSSNVWIEVERDEMAVQTAGSWSQARVTFTIDFASTRPTGRADPDVASDAATDAASASASASTVLLPLRCEFESRYMDDTKITQTIRANLQNGDSIAFAPPTITSPADWYRFTITCGDGHPASRAPPAVLFTAGRGRTDVWMFDEENVRKWVTNRIQPPAATAAAATSTAAACAAATPTLPCDSVLTAISAREWVAIWMIALCCMPTHSAPWHRAVSALVKRAQSDERFTNAKAAEQAVKAAGEDLFEPVFDTAPSFSLGALSFS